MSARRVALLAALAAVVLWAAKALAIAVAGGLDRSRLEAPLFLLGLLALIVAGAALGAAVAEVSTPVLRVVAAIGGAFGVVAASVVTAMVIDPFTPADPHWVWEELNLWVTGLGVLAAAYAVDRRAKPRVPLTPPRG